MITSDSSIHDIEVSTQTVIGISNIYINTQNLYKKFKVTPYTVEEKRRGRKKKEHVQTVPQVLADGNIVTVKLGDQIRGVDMKPKKRLSKHFRNALTIVMYVDNKFVNFKITKNGRFQFTGCKKIHQVMSCIKFMWEQIHADNYLLDYKASLADELYTFHEGNKTFHIKFLTVMTNIDFNVGFPINREKLDVFINERTRHKSLLETSFGYTGVNIKIEIRKVISFNVPCMYYNVADQTWEEYTISSTDMLNAPDMTKYLSTNRSNTFLVFHSGNIIMSGFNINYMEDCFKMFVNLLLTHRKIIETRAQT